MVVAQSETSIVAMEVQYNIIIYVSEEIAFTLFEVNETLDLNVLNEGNTW